MIKLLPFILIPVLLIAGLGYWRFQAPKTTLTSSESVSDGPVEVPATLPGATLEERVKVLEQVVTKLVGQLNIPNTSKTESSSSDAKITALETAVSDLKAKVAVLEKASPTTTTSSTSKSTVYIPLGSGGKWADKDWYTTSEYEVLLDPANYPGYTGMVLEVTFRIGEAPGTGSVRLYNTTDNSSISSQLDTTTTTFSLKTSSSFTLATGAKTYKLQVKSPEQRDIYIQSARIKVNF